MGCGQSKSVVRQAEESADAIERPSDPIAMGYVGPEYADTPASDEARRRELTKARF